MRLALLCLCLFASPVRAQDYLAFQSPSGNIHCAIFAGEDAQARCDIQDFTPSFTRRPADCDLDWGYAFVVGPYGRAGVACAGDTVIDDAARVLQYGREVSLDGMTCTSLITGMVCLNEDGYGFQIAKRKQELF